MRATSFDRQVRRSGDAPLARNMISRAFFFTKKLFEWDHQTRVERLHAEKGQGNHSSHASVPSQGKSTILLSARRIVRTQRSALHQ